MPRERKLCHYPEPDNSWAEGLKTPQRKYEERLEALVAELEAETKRLTAELSERTQELLEALDDLEAAGLL